MAHEMWELKQRQSLPLKAKIQMTITRVREWYEYWQSKVRKKLTLQALDELTNIENKLRGEENE